VRFFRRLFLLAPFGLATISSPAAFVLLEDFNALSPGPIGGQNGWVDSAANGRVVADPADPANQIVVLTNSGANIYRTLGNLTISNNFTGTVHFRMRWPGATWSIYSGLTDVAAPTPSAAADYEPHIRCEPGSSQLLKARDAGAYDTLATLQSNVWYQVWMVVNNSRDLFSVYLQGGAFSSQIQLTNVADGERWFSFRNTSGDGFNTNTSSVANALICFNLKTTSSHLGQFLVDDIYIDPTATNLASPLVPVVDTNPPVVSSIEPPPGAAVTTLPKITVAFNEAVGNVAAAHLLVNGLPATNVSGAGASWTWRFPPPAFGAVNVAWATNQTISDLASNKFNATGSTWNYTLEASDVTPPAISSLMPSAGSTVGNLTSVTITFTEPVTVIEASDLLVNGLPATGLSGSGNVRTFTFSPPGPGVVQFGWDGSHAISDALGNRFDETLPTAIWSYNLLDQVAPTVLTTFPLPAATVGVLTNIQITFSEPVAGLDAADFRINNVPAQSVSGSGAGPYLFTFPQPANGTVNLTWTGGHGIQDLASPPNNFGGSIWSYTLASSALAPDVVLNEILAENLTGLADADGDTSNWIEIHNRGATSVNLTGWSFTDDPDQPGQWVFPARTLGAGQFLVVFASGKNRTPTTPGTNLHTNFKLGASGYLGLFNAESPRRVVSEFTPEYPEQRGNIAWGRGASNVFTYFATPTPGASNSSAVTYSGVTETPAASSCSGFFDLPFSVALSSRTAGASIYYTLDGRPPTIGSTPYTGSIPVAGTPTKAVVMLRAMAVKAGWLSSPVLTRTFIFPNHVATQPALPAGFPAIWDSPCSVGGNCADTAGDYEMDPQVVDTGTYAARLRQGLTAIPTVSIVTRTDLLFGPAQGVYVRREDFNQQPINVEFLEPDGGGGFQADCGLEIQGGTSPTDSGGNWKSKALSLRLIFRGDFGPVTRVNYPLYPDSPVEEFNTLVLDAGLNMNWHHMTDANQRLRADYVRDQYVSDLMNAAGRTGTHGRYVHLYLNGLYWGLYNLHERPDDSFNADYFGGERNEYDVLKHTATSGGLVSGNLTAWNAMMAVARSGVANPNTFDTLAAQHLDVPWFIDYMLVNLWAGNTDWAHHNWYAGRRRLADEKWRFLSWDAEHVLKSVGENRVDLNNANAPTELFQLLRANPEFIVQFGDCVHRHCFNSGMLYTDPANPIWNPNQPERNRPATLYAQRIKEIDLPIIAESARWGDAPTARTNQPYTRDKEWIAEVNSLLGLTNSPGNTVNYFPQRTTTVLNQFRTAGLYPLIAAPKFSQHGGRVAPGYTLFLTNLHGAGTVYFTTNGTDPRIPVSGAVSGAATAWTGAPLLLGQTTTVRSRCLVGTNWSALNEATFDLSPIGPALAVTELMYNPPSGDAFEFIELRYLGATTFDASSCTFDGITYHFPPNSMLVAGQLIVLANNSDPAAFANRYPGVSVFGWFGGRLDNGGERITLQRPTGEILFSLDYDDDLGWDKEADGGGPSLEVLDTLGDPDAPANWRATSHLGTPGVLSTNPPPGAAQLNEVMAANTSAVSNAVTFPDWIELFNASTSPVSLAGWSLSDDGNARKFVFPAGAAIDEGGFLVVWCDTNTALPGLHSGFPLDRDGETITLFNSVTSRVDAVTFGRQLTDLSVGRLGGEWTLTTPTPAAPNFATPTTATTNLFLNEWLANAPPGGSDWVELFNAAPLPVSLRGIGLTSGNKVHQIRALSFLGAHDHTQLFADEQPGVDHLDITLPAAGGSLVLYDATSVERDRVSFGAQVENASQGRLPDGGSTITSFTLTPSPGASNYVSAYTGPLLNEVLALNRTILTNLTGHTADWIELFNPNPGSFTLAGFRLGVSMDANDAWAFPSGAAILGFGHFLIWFSNDHPASTNLGPELHTGRALTGGGDAVYLFNPQGQIVDVVEFGLQAPDLSIGRVAGQWRLLASPTPAQSNTPPATLGSAAALRFNEWFASPLLGQEEFFELFNPGTQPVELGGLFVTDDLSINGRTQFTLPPLSFIGPRGFAVLNADGETSLGRDHTNFKLDADAESLRLYSTNLAAIDTVVFGLQAAGGSEGRWPDGASVVNTFTCATPGASNGVSDLTITGPPQSQTVVAGGTVSFSVTASGTPPLAYQWLRAGAPIAGATQTTLLLSPVLTNDAGSYQVVITNACVTRTSAVALLTMVLLPQLGGTLQLDNGGFEFWLLGQAGQQYSIEKSTNLLTWDVLETVTPTDSPWLFHDAAATKTGNAFYRARLLLP